MSKRTIIRPTLHSTQTENLEQFSLSRVNVFGRAKALEWLHDHPFQHRYWFGYLSVRTEMSPAKFIERISEWLQRLTDVEPVKNKHRGTRGSICTALALGIPKDEQDPRLHASLILAAENRIPIKCFDTYNLGMKKVRIYDPTQYGSQYCYDHHQLVNEVRFFVPTRQRHQKFSKEEMIKMSLHHRLGIISNELTPSSLESDLPKNITGCYGTSRAA